MVFGSNSTKEVCAGIVKGAKVLAKNKAQHYANLELLSVVPELKSAFINTPPLGNLKQSSALAVSVDQATSTGLNCKMDVRICC